MAGLIVFGGISFQRMGISQMPDVNFPVVNVALRLDNAAPEVMEMDVVDVIEDAVMGIEGLKSRDSASVSQGIANITCEFNLNHNIDVAMQQVVKTRSRTVFRTSFLPRFLPSCRDENQSRRPADPLGHGHGRSRTCRSASADDVRAQHAERTSLSTISGVGNVTLGRLRRSRTLRVWLNT